MTVTVETPHTEDVAPDPVADAASSGSSRESVTEAGPPPSTDVVLAEEPMAGAVLLPEDVQTRQMIEVSRLEPMPGHVREDWDLNPTFLESIANAGVDVPIRIVPDPDKPGHCLIVDGVRRWAGAREVGRTHIPYDFDPSIADDVGRQHLSAYIANEQTLGKPKSTFEQLHVLWRAAEAGVSRTELRKAAGKTAPQLKAELTAGKQLSESKALAAMLADVAERDAELPEWTVDEAILIAPFADDPDALQVIASYKVAEDSIAYAVERLNRERDQQAEYDQVIVELTDAGITLAKDLPDGAVKLNELLVNTGEDAEAMTVEAHKDCPDRGAVVTRGWNGQLNITHYCADPHVHGHGYQRPLTAKKMAVRADLVAAGRTVTDGVPYGAARLDRLRKDGKPITAEEHLDCPGARVAIEGYSEPEIAEYCLDATEHGHTVVERTSAPAAKKDDGPPMKLRIEGRKAWQAAAKVRRDWLANLLANRKSAPKVLTSFVTWMVVNQPSGVRDALSGTDSTTLFTAFTRRDPGKADQEWETLTDGRRMVLAMARIAAAFEAQMSGDTFRDYTWRIDRANHSCSRALAGRYLRLLIELGYPPSPIERAVAAGLPYLGDGVPLPAGDTGPEEDEEPDIDEAHGDVPPLDGEQDEAEGNGPGAEDDLQVAADGDETTAAQDLDDVEGGVSGDHEGTSSAQAA